MWIKVCEHVILWFYLSVFVAQSSEDFFEMITFFGVIAIIHFKATAGQKRSHSNNNLLNNTLRNDGGSFIKTFFSVVIFLG